MGNTPLGNEMDRLLNANKDFHSTLEELVKVASKIYVSEFSLLYPSYKSALDRANKILAEYKP